MAVKTRVYLGIFFISAAMLAFEISLIRFFSIAQWYHFAFMVVSIALFGIAVAGTYVALKKHQNPLYVSSLLFSLSVIVGFFIINGLVFDPFRALVSTRHIFILFFYYIFLGLPFFFFGIILAHIFAIFQERAGVVYFANMSGSALGAATALLLVSLFGVKTIIIISLLGLVSSVFFLRIGEGYSRVEAFSLFKKKGVILLLVIANLALFLLPLKLTISTYKELPLALNVPGSQLLETRANSFSRVDVVKSSFAKYAPGLSPAFDGTIPQQIGITVDAANMSAITTMTDSDFVDYLPAAVPYFLTENKNTLIIHPGAGLDVLTALHHDATVTAVEPNPIVIDLLKRTYADYSGNIYKRADVIFGDGRGFIKRAQGSEYYDIIVLSLTGSVLGNAAGISGLNENYLLTKEALQEYYKALTDNGVFVITRWLSFPPRESLRLFTMALEVDDSAQRLALFRSLTTVTLLVFKNEPDDTIIQRLKAFVEKGKFDIIYLPSDFEPNTNLKFKEPYYANAVQNILEDKSTFYKTYLFDVRPVTDDRPFYSHFFKISKMKELFSMIGQRWNPFFDSGFLLLVILAQSLVLTIAFILLPLYFFYRKHHSRGQRKSLVYFFAIGISYLFIELVLIQKFILFLGHVAYASSVVIFSMLLFSSLGALLSQRIKVTWLRLVVATVFMVVLLYLLVLNPLIGAFIAYQLSVKILLSIVILAPLGFIMGMPFPLGMRMIKKGSVAWAWAVNGSASVLSPILAILIALWSGYSLVLLLAGILYVTGSFFISARLSQSAEQSARQ